MVVEKARTRRDRVRTLESSGVSEESAEDDISAVEEFEKGVDTARFFADISKDVRSELAGFQNFPKGGYGSRSPVQ